MPETRAELEHFARQVAEAIPHLVWAASPDGNCIATNQRWSAYTGLSAEASKGVGWLEAIHPDDRSFLAARWAAALQSGAPFEERHRIQRADKSYRWFVTRAELLFDEHGRPLRWLGITTDVDGIGDSRLHQREEGYRLVSEAVQGLLYEWDVRTGVVNRSAGLVDVIGFSPDEAAPDAAWWMSRVHPGDRARLDLAWRKAVRDGETRNEQYRVRHRDGHWVHVSDRAVLVRDGEGAIIRVVGSTVDISEQQAAEMSLRESERRFRATFEDAPVGVAHTDVKGTFTFVNRAFSELVGYTQEELRGMTWQAMTHPDDLESVLALAEKALNREIPHYTTEKRYLRKDGSPVWVQLFGNFVRNDDLEFVQGVAVAVNINPRRIAEQRLAAVLASIDDHLVCYDQQLRYTYVNDAAVKLLGKPRVELLGKRTDELFPDAAGNLYDQKLHEVLRERSPALLEHYYPAWDRWFQNFLYPSEEGVTVFAIDITDRKRAEQALLESEVRFRTAVTASPLPMMIHAEDGEVITINDAWAELSGYSLAEISNISAWLRRAYGGERATEAEAIIQGLYSLTAPHHEGEFTIRTRSGAERIWDFRTSPLGRDERNRRLVMSIASDVTEQRAAKEALREANRRKDDFLAMLGHELRNGLGPIRNASQILRQLGPEEAAGRHAVDIVDRQVTHMARLVDDLLDVSRISQGMVHLLKETCDLGLIVRQAADDQLAALQQQGLTLTLELPETPVWVEGDRTRLSQVLSNLVQNAVKFTDPGGRVTVRVLPDAQVGQALITVEDTGVGIHASLLTSLFEPFTQAKHNVERSVGGLGLGLALVKGLIELHGGEVEAKSEGLGRGSTFSLRLPLVEGTRVVSASAGGTTHESLRILVVDDNRDAAESLQLLLSLAGHQVEVAFDGAGALERALTVFPHAVVCDIGLPRGMDGYAVARALRANPSFKSARLIALSGYAQKADVLRAHEAGFDRHLTKPADLDALRSALAGVSRNS